MSSAIGKPARESSSANGCDPDWSVRAESSVGSKTSSLPEPVVSSSNGSERQRAGGYGSDEYFLSINRHWTKTGNKIVPEKGCRSFRSDANPLLRHRKNFNKKNGSKVYSILSQIPSDFNYAAKEICGNMWQRVGSLSASFARIVTSVAIKMTGRELGRCGVPKNRGLRHHTVLAKGNR